MEITLPDTAPNHSNSYLRRISGFCVMPESYHREHFIQRMQERFSISITETEYYEILERVKKIQALYQINRGTYIIPINIKGKDVWILYGRSTSKDRYGNSVPRRLKTALVPNEMYLVPDCLNKVYDNISFSKQLKKIISQLKTIADKVDISDKTRFFKYEDLDLNLKKFIFAYRSGKKFGEHVLIKYAVNQLIEKTLTHEKK